MSSPIVSVLMTAYNREQYIAQAIASVLESQFTSFELIVVDDCSTDDTVSIVHQFAARDKRIRFYMNEQNLGDYPNRNKAASYARGKYIKFLDADDAIYPWGLGAMVAAMETFPEAGFGLASKPEDNRCYPVCITPKETYLEHFYGFGHFDRGPGSAIIKTECFREAGTFSGKQFIGDQELWFILARKYKMVKFPFDLYWNRLHENQQLKLEMKLGDKVVKLREQIIQSSLTHQDCPLSKTEVREIIKLQKRLKLKSKIFNAFKIIAGK